ncbi:hypothetical protein SETIT_4G268000v2 [Setaria italica]|uniref:Uncharacterized protein n=1 Tax=Setaria italica TaxID=4555 RepID=A0A368QYN2_SETIT|nr:hypothetical protein SETIT_4G268000v2 [Setaria italica]
MSREPPPRLGPLLDVGSPGRSPAAARARRLACGRVPPWSEPPLPPARPVPRARRRRRPLRRNHKAPSSPSSNPTCLFSDSYRKRRAGRHWRTLPWPLDVSSTVYFLSPPAAIRDLRLLILPACEQRNSGRIIGHLIYTFTADWVNTENKPAEMQAQLRIC